MRARRTVLSVIIVSLMGGAVAVCQEDGGLRKERKDLGERLVRGESSDQDVMSRVIRRMVAVEEQLTRRYDPGPKVQALQRRILEELDQAIASAVGRSRRGSGGEGRGDMRRRTGQRPPEPPGGGAADGPGPGRDGTGGAVREGESVSGGPLREWRRGWGQLPARDREAVLQGAREASLGRYREWIERYYRALVEEDVE